MKVATKSGRVLNDADLERIAAKAEAGFDISAWRQKPGRPYLSTAATEHSPRIAVRVPEELRDEVVMRATAEGKNLSQVVRGLLEDYAHRPVRGDPPHRLQGRRAKPASRVR